MRQWMIPPTMLCSKHLRGEHLEHHMFVGSINNGTSMKGYIERGYLEVHRLRERHDELAREMERRGMNHRSPLPPFEGWTAGRVDVVTSLHALLARCPDCRVRMVEAGRRLCRVA